MVCNFRRRWLTRRVCGGSDSHRLPCPPSRSPCRDGRLPPGTRSGAAPGRPPCPTIRSPDRRARLREVMGDRPRARLQPLWRAQDLGRATVQRLPAALEQAVVGRVLDQRVLEAIGRLAAARRRRTGGRVGEPIQATLAAPPRRVPATSLQQRVGEIATEHRADLRDFARCPSRSSRAASDCCKRRRDRLHAACSPRSSSRRVTSSTNSGTPPVRSLTPSITSLDSACRAEISPTMRRDLRAVERGERDQRCGASAGSRAAETPAASSPR